MAVANTGRYDPDGIRDHCILHESGQFKDSSNLSRSFSSMRIT
jgi:hypothetical protein